MNQPNQSEFQRVAIITRRLIAVRPLRYSQAGESCNRMSHLEMNSPAIKAGFRRGDIIVSWGGRPVRDVEDCAASDGPTAVAVRRKDETVELTLPKDRHGVVVDRLYFEVK